MKEGDGWMYCGFGEPAPTVFTQCAGKRKVFLSLFLGDQCNVPLSSKLE